MIRAANPQLVLTVLLAIAAPAFAQEDSANAPAAAVQEAVRRQASTVELRQKLIEAGQAEQHRELLAAAKLYQAAYKLSQEVGSGIDAETKSAIAGVSRIGAALAQQAQELGDYKGAEARIKSALLVDPKNQTLLTLKRNNDAWFAAQAGKIPSAEVKEREAGVIASKIKNSTLVQDGKLLYELGKWDEAEAKFRVVLAEEADNTAAIYYIKLVQDARYGASDSARELTARKRIVEVEDVWRLPVKRDLLPTPNPYLQVQQVHTGVGRAAIVSKLDLIRLSEVKYDGLELAEVIRNLSEVTRKSDPDKVGINFMIIGEAASAGGATGAVDPTTGLPIAAAPADAVDISTVRVKINPPMNNLRLADVLDAIVKTADRPIKYSIEDYCIVFSARAAETPALFTRTFKVDPNTFFQGLQSVSSMSFGSSSGGSGGGGGGGNRGGGGGGGNRGGGGGNQNGGGGGQNGGSETASLARVSVAGGGSGGGQNGGGGISSGGGIAFVTRTTSTPEAQSAFREFFSAA